jgi:hypothetical protein
MSFNVASLPVCPERHGQKLQRGAGQPLHTGIVMYSMAVGRTRHARRELNHALEPLYREKTIRSRQIQPSVSP